VAYFNVISKRSSEGTKEMHIYHQNRFSDWEWNQVLPEYRLRSPTIYSPYSS